MTDISTIRHKSVFDPTEYKHVPVHIIGAGALGSRIWLALVELGLTNIKIYDFDKVEGHNLANQIFLNEHIGMPKVDACAAYYKLKTGAEPPEEMEFVNSIVDQFTFEVDSFEGIMFLAVDTMKARYELVDRFIANSNERRPLCFIDGRMASSHGNVHTINVLEENAISAWKDTLIDDDEAEASPCGTSISVGATASLITNLAVWQFMHVLKDPIAVDKYVNLHLKPLMMGTG